MGVKKLLRKVLPKSTFGDTLYNKFDYYRAFGCLPQRNPTRFNDHLTKIKSSGALYDPLVQFVTDKEYAKIYIAAIVGERYTIKTHRILRNQDELLGFRPDTYPCVIKPTHLSGYVMFCANQSATFNLDEMREWFNINHYVEYRERNYRYLSPKIIVEEYYSDNNESPHDYKIYCFNGKAKIIQVDADRFARHTKNFYAADWTRLDVVCEEPGRELNDAKPLLLSEMVWVAEELATPHRFVRVDTYATRAGLKVGELTFLPLGARGRLLPHGVEYTWGQYFDE